MCYLWVDNFLQRKMRGDEAGLGTHVLGVVDVHTHIYSILPPSGKISWALHPCPSFFSKEPFNQTIVGEKKNSFHGKMAFCRAVDSFLSTSSLHVAPGSFLHDQQGSCKGQQGWNSLHCPGNGTKPTPSLTASCSRVLTPIPLLHVLCFSLAFSTASRGR